MVTLEDARTVAALIKQQSSQVQRIELFGSVAENGKGHDIDLMLIVDQELARKFWSEVENSGVGWIMPPLFLRRLIKKYFLFLDQAFKDSKKTRLLWASNIIEFDLVNLGKNYGSELVIDPWLVSADWRLRINSLTKNRNMRVVLRRAAQSAIKL